MSLIRYENLSPLAVFQRDLSRLFDENSNVVTSDWAPPVDIRELPDKYVLQADVPGVDPKGIEITLENEVLTIKGKRELQNAEERKSFKRVERAYGSFHRRFSLPESADADRVTANVRDGVLVVEIPKQEQVLPRRIEVQH